MVKIVTLSTNDQYVLLVVNDIMRNRHLRHYMTTREAADRASIFEEHANDWVSVEFINPDEDDKMVCLAIKALPEIPQAMRLAIQWIERSEII